MKNFGNVMRVRLGIRRKNNMRNILFEYFFDRPKVGDIYEFYLDGATSPFKSRNTVVILDIKEKWVKYKSLDGGGWLDMPLWEFLMTYRRVESPKG
jgi:hypothetical protein